jgi:TP901 family phage tail tape measure protein
MAMKVDLVLSLIDKLSGPASKAGASLKGLGKDGVAGSKAASSHVDRLSARLKDLQSQAGNVQGFRALQQTFTQSRAQFRAAQASVQELAKQMAAAEAPSKKMAAAFKRAQQDVRAASQAFRDQSSAIVAAKRAVESGGVPITRLAEHERRLQSSIQMTTNALKMETRALAARDVAARRSSAGTAGAAMATVGRGRGGRRGGGGGGNGLVHNAADEAASMLTGRALLSSSGGGAAIAGIAGAMAIRKSTQAALSMEKVMYDVQRATDVSGAALTEYQNKVMNLARATGKTKEEIGGILASAGFAGVPKDDLLRFTEFATKATTAWGTSAEDTGQGLAELRNTFGANQKRLEEIGDAVNVAADVSASKEADLLEFLRRAGATANLSKISAEETLAFAAALKEVGVRTDTAATGFEALVNVMKLGEEFSSKAGEGLKSLGLNSTKMRKQFVAKPVETMIMLLQKLQGVTDPLKKAEIMTNIFGKEYQDDISKLLNGLPRLNELLEKVKDKSKNIGSVGRDFTKKSATDFNKIDRATQSMDVAMTRVGNAFKIVGGAMAEDLNKNIDNLEKIVWPWNRWKEEADAFTEARRKALDIASDDPDRVAKALDPNRKEQASDDLPEGTLATTLRALNPFAKPPSEADTQRMRDRDRLAGIKRAAAANVQDEEDALAAPGSLAAEIKRIQAGPGSAMARPAVRDIANKRIAELTQQLSAAEAKAEQVRSERTAAPAETEALKRKRLSKTFTLDPSRPGEGVGPVTGQVGHGLLNFGLGGRAGQTFAPPATSAAPMPPRRPVEFGGKPEVDASELDDLSRKAAETGGKMKEAINVTLTPGVALGPLQQADSLLDSILGKMKAIAAQGGAVVGAARSAARGLEQSRNAALEDRPQAG